MSKHLRILGLSLWIGTLSALGRADDSVTLKYRFKPGDILRYDGRQTLSVTSTVSGTTQKFSSQTSSLREWKVLAVDKDGNAQLAMTILRVQVDATNPDGKKITFDTEKDGGKGPLAVMIGQPLLEAKLSPLGQLLDIRESQSAAAGQFIAHVRTLLYPVPAVAVTPGTGWQHDLELPLPPPVGNGEQIRIRQTFRLEKVTDSVAMINLKSAPAEEIKDRAVLAKVAQFLPGGRIELDLSRGVVRSLELDLDQTVSDFAGSESVLHVTGSYREVLKDDLAKAAPRRQ